MYFGRLFAIELLQPEFCVPGRVGSRGCGSGLSADLIARCAKKTIASHQGPLIARAAASRCSATRYSVRVIGQHLQHFAFLQSLLHAAPERGRRVFPRARA